MNNQNNNKDEWGSEQKVINVNGVSSELNQGSNPNPDPNPNQNQKSEIKENNQNSQNNQIPKNPQNNQNSSEPTSQNNFNSPSNNKKDIKKNNRPISNRSLFIILAIFGLLIVSIVLFFWLESGQENEDAILDAVSKSGLSGVPVVAVMYMSDNDSSYEGVCSRFSKVEGGGCFDSKDQYGTYVKLSKKNVYYCVDSSGFAGEIISEVPPINEDKGDYFCVDGEEEEMEEMGVLINEDTSIENNQLVKKKVETAFSNTKAKTDDIYRTWHSNGQLSSEGKYENGEKVGVWKGWFSNGQLAVEGEYENREEVGIQRMWYLNGQLFHEGKYENGKEVGIHKWWHSNGQLEYEGKYENGEEVGIHKGWYFNRQLSCEGKYENGKEVGIHRTWYLNGQLSSEGKYENGEEVGIHRVWDLNGELIFEEEY